MGGEELGASEAAKASFLFSFKNDGSGRYINLVRWKFEDLEVICTRLFYLFVRSNKVIKDSALPTLDVQ